MSNWNISWNGKLYPAKWYSPKEDGCIGHCAYDSETTLIKPGEIADYVIASAYNGTTVYYITKDTVKAFVDNHKDKMLFMANASFDLHVLEKIKAVKSALEEASIPKHVIDLLLLQKLYKIGMYGRDLVPSLDMLAEEHLKLNLPKDAKVALSAEIFQAQLTPEFTEDKNGLKNLRDYIKVSLLKVYKELLWNDNGEEVDLKLLLKDLDYYLEPTVVVKSKKDGDKEKSLSVSMFKGKKKEEGEDSTNYRKLIPTLITAFEKFKANPFRKVRVSYGNFLREDLTVDYSSMEQEAFWYAGVDVIATYEIAQRLIYKVKQLCQLENAPAEKLLSHDLQLQSAVALDNISRYGFYVDRKKLIEVKTPLVEELKKHLQVLEKYNYRPGTGSNARFQELVEEYKLKIPKTEKTGKFKTDADSLKKYRDVEWVNSYLEYQTTNKLLSFLNLEKNVVHTRFNPIVATGRTSSSKPNIQNVPRGEGIRSIFSARPGKGIISRDYSALELATLAQVCFSMYGFSKMRDLINKGVDLHTYYASKLLKKPMENVSKDERQKAKAVNFGFPGGLGIAKFIEYAENTYNVLMSETEAKEAKQVWLDTFPEMKKYLSDSKAMEVMLDSGLLASYSTVNSWGKPEMAYWVLKGILSGQTGTKSGRNYTDKEIEWGFGLAEKIDFPNKKQKFQTIINEDGEEEQVRIPGSGLEENVRRREGNFWLWSSFCASFTSVVYSSGRIRGWCGYTESKNSPFQGLAADGAKLAVANLIRAGHKVVNFIHDEVLVEVDLDQDNRPVDADIARIMEESMKVFVPDVQVKTEGEYMVNWAKSGTHLLDDRGRFVPIPSKEEKKLVA